MSSIGLQRAARQRAVIASCRARKISDDERHDIQRAVVGKSSLKDMSIGELNALLDHINRDKHADEWRFVFRMAADRQPYAKKIYRLAQRLGQTMDPPVSVASKKYVESIASRMRGGTTAIEFCGIEQLVKIIQALDIHLGRVEK